jgi:hypothetical protein
MARFARLSDRVRDALWRGRGEAAIEMVRTLIASLREAIPALPAFLAGGLARPPTPFKRNEDDLHTRAAPRRRRCA